MWMKNWNDWICPKVVTIFRIANVLKGMWWLGG